MTEQSTPELDDLACDRALGLLSEQELTSFISQLQDPLAVDEFELAAAELELAQLGLSSPAANLEALTPEFERRLQASALAFGWALDDAARDGDSGASERDNNAASLRLLPAVPAPPAPDYTRYAGWAAAAVALIALAVIWSSRPEPVALQPRPAVDAAVAPEAAAPKEPTVAEQRQALLSSGKDAQTIAWTATKDAAATGASGDVVWSTAEQRGYMRFKGLEPNDPKRSQYQLWIFGKDHDERFPVDGGVFDVSSSGEVIVAIDPRLPVTEPTLFAITVEKPGGVVVSKRERIVVTAAVGG